ncbi:MAG: HAMP domain-containing histidine kinase [Proteobacteria bacterium]|nr:HAMP domain-containing histidine kinase [Pseudomonadota bacterium]
MTGKKLSLPPLAESLSARLLLLTIAFVMLAEVLIYAPSIGRFRLVYLEERLAAAHLAILALEATPDQMIGEDLKRELLDHVGAYSVGLTRPGAGKLMLMVTTPGPVDASYDLREASFFGLIGDAFMTLMDDGGRILRVVGVSPKDRKTLVEVVLEEAPLRRQMLGYSERILALSLVISLFTAALVYLSLHLLMVRPMRRITESMARFRDDPEDASRIIKPSARSDEVGVAQRELAEMQEGLRGALRQRARLAALGAGITKISHDLRNILATARLVSDRLVESEDPEVRRTAPTLLSAIDRAVNLCAQTLNFTSEGAPAVDLSRFDLGELVREVGASLPEQLNGQARWHSLIEENFEVSADREQLHRVLSNLGQNAVQAGATKVEVAARRDDDRFVIDVTDNGPGLSPRARAHLFKPFAGSSHPGGTGLGLAIARELMRAHGGDVQLERSTSEGTRFRLILPADRGQR